MRASRAAALRLRVASRGGVWPDSVTQAFRALWGTDGVGVYTLAPLRREDAALAAVAWGASADFLATVAQAEATAWAALPLTLRWLVQLVTRDAALPATRRELFERGALLLCEEQNPDRRNADRFGLLEPRQRLALAGRLASLMRFGDRASLSLARQGEHPEGSLPGTDAEGTEWSAGTPFTVGPTALRDLARDTTLFRPAGTDLYRWTQESTADFLAAWYLDHRGTTPTQMLSLVTDPDDGHVVPQLIEVAAWVASFRLDAFKHLVETDPNIALGADPQSLPPDARRDGLDLYLAAIGDGRIRTLVDPVLASYRSVAHPELTDQLRAWISDDAKPERGRAAAARAAAHNQIADLAPDLLALSLDANAPPSLRATAVYALQFVATADQLAQLRPVALDQVSGEDSDRLRASVRDVLWPGQISFADLVASVARSPDDDTAGHLFSEDPRLGQPLNGQAVPGAVIVEALDWIADGHADQAPPLALGAIVAAAHRAAVPEIGRRLAPLLVEVASRDAIDGPRWATGVRTRNPEIRRALAAAEGPRPEFVAAFVGALAHAETPSVVFRAGRAFEPVRHADVPELIRLLLDAPDDATRTVCERLLRSVSTSTTPAVLDETMAALREAAQQSPVLQAIVRDAYDAWDLDRDEVQQWRRDFYVPPEVPPPPLSPTVPERLDAALARPPVEAWRDVCRALALRPDGRPHYGPATFETDPTRLPGWEVLDEEDQARVAGAAEAYVDATAPDESDWAETEADPDTRTYRVLDGIRALTLLYRRGIPVTPERWVAWTPAVLIRAAEGMTSERLETHAALVARAWNADPDGFRNATAHAYASLGDVDALRRAVETLGEPSLDDVLVSAIRAGQVEGNAAHHALRGLLSRRTPGAGNEVVRLAAGEEQPQAAAWWALLYLDSDPEAAWTAFADRIATDDAFARALLYRIADRFGEPALPTETPIPALVTLERRLHALFPPAADPPIPKGIHSPTPDDEIRDIRGGFAAVLASKGTADAVAAVDALADALSMYGAQYQSRRARGRRREAAHRPVRPQDLLALVDRADARLVRSAQELFDVTVEALGGFESWIRDGEAPRVFDLWNAVPRADALHIAATLASTEALTKSLAADVDALRLSTKKNPSFSFPKDEAALADLALRFLRDRLGPRGILVTREAEVKRGHATDLYVSAPAPGDAPAATVVIEVKGSWHSHVYSALASQLVDGYLDGSTRRHGIYLVGWYGPDGWYRLTDDVLHPKATLSKRGGKAAFTNALEKRARTAAGANKQVVVLVVDASLPPSRASA